jgi:hypothetical protein
VRGSPDSGQQVSVPDHLPGVTGEVGEDFIFLRRQADDGVASLDPTILQIDRQERALRVGAE